MYTSISGSFDGSIFSKTPQTLLRGKAREAARQGWLTDWLITTACQYNTQARDYSAASFLMFQSACGTDGAEECTNICSSCREIFWPTVDHHDLDTTVVGSWGVYWIS